MGKHPSYSAHLRRREVDDEMLLATTQVIFDHLNYGVECRCSSGLTQILILTFELLIQFFCRICTPVKSSKIFLVINTESTAGLSYHISILVGYIHMSSGMEAIVVILIIYYFLHNQCSYAHETEATMGFVIKVAETL